MSLVHCGFAPVYTVQLETDVESNFIRAELLLRVPVVRDKFCLLAGDMCPF